MQKNHGVVSGEIYGYDTIVGGSKKGGSRDLKDHPAFKLFAEAAKAKTIVGWSLFNDGKVGKESQRSINNMLIRGTVSVDALKDKVHELETSLGNSEHHRLQSESRLHDEINEVHVVFYYLLVFHHMTGYYYPIRAARGGVIIRRISTR